ncbi:MAG TPA: hypothetical protein VHB45_12940 [Alloacidobacterium sp.]|nr:hypothetical protein [Alloacidobacterium sp.]
MNETTTANNPTEANASGDASATLLATAGDGTGTPQQTPTAEAQPATTTETPASAAKTTEEAARKGAPERYAFTAPEGVEYDSEILDAFTGAAKDADLTQEAAQKLIEKMAPAITARQVDQVKAIHKEWLEASSSDKEFGGEKLAENLGVARKAVESFGTPELRALLDETGLGNHPEVIRFFYRAGKAISEDKFVGGSPSGAGKPNPANVLYDKTQKG